MLKLRRTSIAALPRDTRDTLFLLGVIAWIVMLQTGHVPVWTSVGALAILAWRAWISWRGKSLPTWPYRLGVLGLTLMATAMTHHTLLGKDAGVTMVTCLLALKTLEMRARRDAFVIFFLGFFTLLTHLFFSQSMLSALGIVIGLLGLLTGLVNAHMPVGNPALSRSLGVAARLSVAGAPIMVALFVFFPRVAPLWALPTDDTTGESGLSDKISIGEIAELALNDSIAFRIRFDSPRPRDDQLYFRGPVLSRFDGKTWNPAFSATVKTTGQGAEVETEGPSFSYVVLMETTKFPWLFTLDLTPQRPSGIDAEAWLSKTGQWMLSGPTGQVLQYSARSFPSYRLETQLDRFSSQSNLFLPKDSNPRTVQMAKSLRERFGTGLQADDLLIEAALRMLREGGYTYTLAPGQFGVHTADEFWFDRKQGFCEHIASSFVILMRAAGIPARIVAGYQGGNLNPVDGYWVVRQSEAHAWAEVWKVDQGWVRIDPTGMVSPGRIGSLGTLRPQPSGIERAVLAVDPNLVSRWRNVWDAVDASWKRWVIDYNQKQQFNLLKNLGVESPDWADLGYVIAALLALGSLGAGAWTAWERHQQDPWLRLLGKAQARMARQGWVTDADSGLTPQKLIRQMDQHLAQQPPPEWANRLTDWLQRMERWRYAPNSTDTLGKLKSDLSRMPWPTPRQNRS